MCVLLSWHWELVGLTGVLPTTIELQWVVVAAAAACDFSQAHRLRRRQAAHRPHRHGGNRLSSSELPNPPHHNHKTLNRYSSV